ncbi:MAG: hypothetical protein IJX99_08395 [Clostridia bacterium]|nr:hypothetical protein [Clostridia bacterium]
MTINSPGQRIRGKIDFFKPALDPLLTNINTANGLEILRENLKDAVALRMAYTRYAPLNISDECINIIEQYTMNNLFQFSFIRCSLNYYRGNKEHIVKNFDESCSSCKSKDFHKSLQHAKEDCLYCSKHYINKIKNLKFCSSDIIKKCSAIETSINFVCKYIYAMLEGNLPSIIKKVAFENILRKSVSICNIYAYNQTGDNYKLINPKTPYKSVNSEIATEIFCSNFKF